MKSDVLRLGLRHIKTKVQVRAVRSNTATRGTLQKALLDQVGLQHIFNGIPFFTDRGSKVIQADRAPHEFVDNRHQQFAIHVIETAAVDVQHIQSF